MILVRENTFLNRVSFQNIQIVLTLLHIDQICHWVLIKLMVATSKRKPSTLPKRFFLWIQISSWKTLHRHFTHVNYVIPKTWNCIKRLPLQKFASILIISRYPLSLKFPRALHIWGRSWVWLASKRHFLGKISRFWQISAWRLCPLICLIGRATQILVACHVSKSTWTRHIPIRTVLT